MIQGLQILRCLCLVKQNVDGDGLRCRVDYGPWPVRNKAVVGFERTNGADVGRYDLDACCVQLVEYCNPKLSSRSQECLHIAQDARRPVGNGKVAELENLHDGLLESNRSGCLLEQGLHGPMVHIIAQTTCGADDGPRASNDRQLDWWRAGDWSRS